MGAMTTLLGSSSAPRRTGCSRGWVVFMSNFLVLRGGVDEEESEEGARARLSPV
jgi:hypothetical protein